MLDVGNKDSIVYLHGQEAAMISHLGVSFLVGPPKMASVLLLVSLSKH